MDVMTLLQDIGSTIGLPAALLVGWMYMKIKDLSAKVSKVESEHTTVMTTLSQIQTDIAVIRTNLDWMRNNGSNGQGDSH